MMARYKEEPGDEEYRHILSNLGPVLSEVEDDFTTAEIRMLLTARSNNGERVESLVDSQINWGLDYLRREGLVESPKLGGLDSLTKYNHDWTKTERYSYEGLERVKDELE